MPSGPGAAAGPSEGPSAGESAAGASAAGASADFSSLSLAAFLALANGATARATRRSVARMRAVRRAMAQLRRLRFLVLVVVVVVLLLCVVISEAWFAVDVAWGDTSGRSYVAAGGGYFWAGLPERRVVLGGCYGGVVVRGCSRGTGSNPVPASGWISTRSDRSANSLFVLHVRLYEHV